MKLGQKGFTLVEGLLIVVALSLVVGVGYYVYDAGKDEPITQSTAPATKSKSATAATAKKDYLVIDELGIKFDKTAVPKAYYKIEQPDSTYPEVKVVGLYDVSYDETTNSKGKKCGDVTDSPPIAHVQLITVADRDNKYAKYKDAEINPIDGPYLVLSDKYAKQVNGYLYSFSKGQGVQAALYCISDAAGENDDFLKAQADNKEVQQKFDETVKNLEQMVGTLEKS